MRFRGLLVVPAAVALFGMTLVLSPSQAAAQTVSPCCAKVCNADGSSTACKPMLLGGLGSGGALAQGCVDLELGPPGSTCAGGTLLGGNPPGLISCLCLFGGTDGAGSCNSGQDGSTLEPNDCTTRSIAGCGENVVKIENDPACTGGGTCEAPGCCRSAAGTCTNFSTASTCTGGGTFVAGKVCTDAECQATVCTPAPGTACDDNNPCTSGETIQSDCTCGGGTDNGTCCCQQFTDHCFTGCNGCTGTCATGTCAEGSGGSSICQTGTGCTPAVGTACDDNNPCTTGETIQSDCTCGGGTDNGTCCCQQFENHCFTGCNGCSGTCATGTCAEGAGGSSTCQTGPGCTPAAGTACDDGNPCTSGETIQSDCTCGGGADNGTCCPTAVGTACDDGNPCTSGETIQPNCTCGGGTDNLTCCCQQLISPPDAGDHCFQGCNGCTGQCITNDTCNAPDSGTNANRCQSLVGF